MQTLLSPAALYLAAAFGAENVTGPKARSADVAEEMDAGLEVLDDDCALAEVYVLNLQP